MKKLVLAIALVCSAMTASAQFYISGSGGIAGGIHKKDLGTDTNSLTGVQSDLEGSFGAGVQTQLRFGYFLNKKISVELMTGYLHGFDQKGTSIEPSVLAIQSRARAYGVSLSGVYHISDKFYGRVGVLSKLGGKTEAVVDLDIDALGLSADFKTDFHGEFPLGVVAALGFKQPISDNWSAFIEIEYHNINVTRKDWSLADFSATLGGNAIDAETLSGVLTAAGFDSLTPLLEDDYDWKPFDVEAPYSSLGLNFGITYTFN